MAVRKTIVGSVAVAVLVAAGAGCGVQRTMVIESDPPGALVYLNDEEVGRTPVRHDFTWYGNYDVSLRREGYQTMRTTQWVAAPWWQWPPIDFLAELTPGRPKDTHRFLYVLKPATQPADPDALLRRAEGLRGRLQTSEYTKPPATRPATTRPAGAPTTRSR